MRTDTLHSKDGHTLVLQYSEGTCTATLTDDWGRVDTRDELPVILAYQRTNTDPSSEETSTSFSDLTQRTVEKIKGRKWGFDIVKKNGEATLLIGPYGVQGGRGDINDLEHWASFVYGTISTGCGLAVVAVAPGAGLLAPAVGALGGSMLGVGIPAVLNSYEDNETLFEENDVFTERTRDNVVVGAVAGAAYPLIPAPILRIAAFIGL